MITTTVSNNLKTSCRYNLSFPLHKEETAIERLSSIQSFMEHNQFDTERLIEGDAVERLEHKVATLFNKPAAMWCATGTLAQGIAARIHSKQAEGKPLFLHTTSHLLHHENDGYQHAHGLHAKAIGGWRQPITADMLSNEAACAFIELGQRHSGGLLPSWEQLTQLKEKAATLNLPLHMDGARVWSCRPFYNNRSFADIADGFDSVYVSLYKDIGAIGGALLIGNHDFIAEAKVWRHRLGGLLIEPWPMICDALRLLDKRLEQMPRFVERTGEMASLLDLIDRVQVDPCPPQTNLFHVLLPCDSATAESARDLVAKETGVWLGNRFWSYEGEHQCALEITVGEKALVIPNDEFLKAMSMLVAMI